MLLVVLVAGCGGETSEKISDSDAKIQEEELPEKRAETTRQIFHRMPTPVELAAILERAGAAYNMELPNPVENVSNYETVFSKAINLGIYSTDLSYASIFEQITDVQFYSTCTKRLADGLGVTEAFSDNTIDRIEANIADRDSILNIITETYYVIDNHLKVNQRASLSMLIMAGGWIEGLYLATNLLESSPGNEELEARLKEQKYSLQNLVVLIDFYKDDPKLATVRQDVVALKQLFDRIEEKPAGEAGTHQNEGTQSVTIETGRSLVLTDELRKEITETVASIRNRYIES